MTEHLSPLNVCIYVFGRIKDVGEACGLTETALHHWKRQSGFHDAGDIKSARYMRSLLAAAQSKGKVLKAEWLIFGAEKCEIDAETLRLSQVAAE